MVLAGILARSSGPGALISGFGPYKRVETTESSQETKNEFHIISYFPGANVGSDALILSCMWFQLRRQSGVRGWRTEWQREYDGERCLHGRLGQHRREDPEHFTCPAGWGQSRQCPYGGKFRANHQFG